MDIKFIPTAITTDALIAYANEYTEGYKQHPDKTVHDECFFRIADFLRFVEGKTEANIKARIDEAKKLQR